MADKLSYGHTANPLNPRYPSKAGVFSESAWCNNGAGWVSAYPDVSGQMCAGYLLYWTHGVGALPLPPGVNIGYFTGPEYMRYYLANMNLAFLDGRVKAYSISYARNSSLNACLWDWDYREAALPSWQE